MNFPYLLGNMLNLACNTFAIFTSKRKKHSIWKIVWAVKHCLHRNIYHLNIFLMIKNVSWKWVCEAAPWAAAVCNALLLIFLALALSLCNLYHCEEMFLMWGESQLYLKVSLLLVLLEIFFFFLGGGFGLLSVWVRASTDPFLWLSPMRGKLHYLCLWSCLLLCGTLEPKALWCRDEVQWSQAANIISVSAEEYSVSIFFSVKQIYSMHIPSELLLIQLYLCVWE